MIDLAPAYLDIVRKILRDIVSIAKVWAFGSRVTGTAKEFSDLDLAIDMGNPIPVTVLCTLKDAFSESDLPVKVDIVDWHAISEEFREVINTLKLSVNLDFNRIVFDKETWQNRKWGDLVTLEYGKRLIDYRESDGEYVVFGTNGPIGRTMNALSNSPTIIIGRKGAYRGVYYSEQPCSVIDTAFYVVPKVEIDMKWAYYALLCQDINGLDSGSAIPSTSRGSFYNLDAFVPLLETQKEIAHILGTLDDKIELNRRMNKTLEEIAQALFKHWFIDFEFPNAEGKPYKSSGGEMIDSELGLIPKGWRVGKVSDEFDITMGQSPPGDTYNQIGDGLPFYQGNADFSFRFPQNRVYCTMPKRLSQAGDTLMSVRAPVGDVNMSIEKSIIGMGVASIQHKHRKSSYTYYFVKAKAQLLRSYDDSGTVFGCITKSNIGSIDHVIPNIDIIDKYNAYTTSTDSLIHSLHIQTDRLNQSKKIYTLEML